jgi:hypothetical protein
MRPRSNRDPVTTQYSDKFILSLPDTLDQSIYEILNVWQSAPDSQEVNDETADLLLSIFKKYGEKPPSSIAHNGDEKKIGTTDLKEIWDTVQQ